MTARSELNAAAADEKRERVISVLRCATTQAAAGALLGLDRRGLLRLCRREPLIAEARAELHARKLELRRKRYSELESECRTAAEQLARARATLSRMLAKLDYGQTKEGEEWIDEVQKSLKQAERALRRRVRPPEAA